MKHFRPQTVMNKNNKMKKHTLITMTIAALLTLTGCKRYGPNIENCENEKAKAILWVDYDKSRLPLSKHASSISTVKVLAEVSPFGSVKIIAFCKEQDERVVKYLLDKLDTYTVRREILEQGYIKPGEQQYLMLRYIPDWMK